MDTVGKTGTVGETATVGNAGAVAVSVAHIVAGCTQLATLLSTCM